MLAQLEKLVEVTSLSDERRSFVERSVGDDATPTGVFDQRWTPVSVEEKEATGVPLSGLSRYFHLAVVRFVRGVGVVMVDGGEGAALPGRLRGVCERIRSLLASATAADVDSRYRVGRLLLQVKRAPGSYGVAAVETLARELGRDAATLYRYALVPQRWSAREMKLLGARLTPSGEPLSWSHLVELARVESEPLRGQLADLALRDGLSVRELARRIDEATEGERARREPSLRETLVSLTTLADRLAAQVSGGLEDALSGDRVTFLRTAELEGLFGRAIEAHTGLHERVRARLDHLTNARAQLLRGCAEVPKRPPARSGGVQASLISGGSKSRTLEGGG